MEVEPQSLHGEALNIEPQARPISAEDEIRFQRNRIAYLRSVGLPWTEALFHLRDSIVGLEDREFWTGVPEPHQQLLEDPDRRDEVIETYARRGWRTTPRRMRFLKRPDGSFDSWPDPTPAELSQMLRIINALLARRGMTWRWSARDEIPRPVAADEVVAHD